MTEHIRLQRGVKQYLQRLIYYEYGNVSMTKGVYNIIQGYIWARSHGYKPRYEKGRNHR